MEAAADFAAIQDAFERIRQEMAKAIVGQDEVIEQLLIGLLSKEHCLLEGPPGVAKSLTAASLARVLGLSFDRIRCTPDLTPQDLIGLGAASPGEGQVAGPLFANVVLVDDVARLSPRASALVQQAIQSDHVVLDARRHWLPDPFLLVATQHAEEEGPSLSRPYHDDRFMLKIAIGYPEYAQEFALAQALSAPRAEPPEQVTTLEELRRFRDAARQAAAPPPVIHYALRLVRATRIHEGETPDFVYEWIDFGAGPRASHFLTLAAKIRAALHGRGVATCADVQAVVHPVLRHRLVTNRNARSTGVTVERVIRRLLYEVPEREPGDETAPAEQS